MRTQKNVGVADFIKNRRLPTRQDADSVNLFLLVKDIGGQFNSRKRGKRLGGFQGATRSAEVCNESYHRAVGRAIQVDRQ